MKKIVGVLIAVILLSKITWASDNSPEILSPSVVLIDAQTGVVLFERNKNQKNYPASITKIMTALLSIENSDENFDSRVYFSRNAVFSIEPGSSNIAMNDEESLSLNDALYGLMLQSANEVANALAENVSGDMDAFAKKMTLRAKELGAVNTNFANPHGLHEQEHYTTAYDMALIMREAIKSPKFVELISTQRYDIPPTERQSEVRILNNTNKMIWPHTKYYNEWVVGGKTGFTNEARHTLVTYGQRDGIELIAAVMGGESGEPYMDTSALLEYGFSSFEDVKLFTPEDYSIGIEVLQTEDGDTVNVGKAKAVATRDVIRHLPKNAKDYVRTEKIIPEHLQAPVLKGQRLGELRIYCNDALQAIVPLVAAEAVAEISFPTVDDVEISTPRPVNITFFAAGVAVLVVIFVLALQGLRASRR